MKASTILILFLIMIVATSSFAEATIYEELDFQGKSREMIQTVIDASPFFIRPITRKSMINGIFEQCKKSGIVKPEDVVTVVKAVTPKKYVDVTLKKIEL